MTPQQYILLLREAAWAGDRGYWQTRQAGGGELGLGQRRGGL